MLILSRLIEKICFQSVVQTIDVRGLFRLILSESCDFHLSTICYYSMPLALPFKAVQPPSSMLAHSLKPEAATSLFSLYGQPIELLLIFSNTKKKKVITGPGFLRQKAREAELLCAAIKLKLHSCLQWIISVNYEYSALVSVGICLIIYLFYS